MMEGRREGKARPSATWCHSVTCTRNHPAASGEKSTVFFYLQQMAAKARFKNQKETRYLVLSLCHKVVIHGLNERMMFSISIL